MGLCNLCAETVPDPELVEHVRVMHPDDYEPPQTWPDGGLVIIDQTDATADEIGKGDQ